jgi:dTDP-4-dehydrorhamnose 3,5-epimerase
MDPLPTRLEGPVLLRPRKHGDARGFFVESFRANVLAERFGISEDFVQDNHSRSSYGVLRGMHFQLEPPAAKLVRCARGAVIDAVVDVRTGSATYGEWEAFELSDENLRVLYVPVGFAHGFAVRSELADVLYKQSAEWSAASDRGFSPNDPEVGIDWSIPARDRILSARDAAAAPLAGMEADVDG